MLRSVKYGLYGAVLAGVVGGSVAWHGVDKTVTLVVDGQAKKVHTTAAQVSDVLSNAGYHLSAHDLVAPSATSAVHEGSTIVYKRGRLLHLDVNGARKDVWTTAPTVAEAMAQLGYSTADFTSVSRSKRLPLSATDIAVRTPKLITLIVDGKKTQVTSTDATVAQLLEDLKISLGHKDTVSVSTDSWLKANATIVVKRTRRVVVTENESVPFPTKVTNDPKQPAGRTQVIKPGRTGLARVTYALVYVNGQIVGRTVLKSVTLRAPIAQVTKVGTKVPPMATPAQAQAIAKAMLKARGWGGNTQFMCLAQLWGHESGWRVNASNPSGAYGIPQALPGSKMGAGWQTDAAVQIAWGLDYIAARYSTPCGAWSTWQAQGGWY